MIHSYFHIVKELGLLFLSIDLTTKLYKRFIPAQLLSLKQVNMDGLTGSVQFSENGDRNRINFEILNLQNNSFKQVSSYGIAMLCFSVSYSLLNRLYMACYNRS